MWQKHIAVVLVWVVPVLAFGQGLGPGSSVGPGAGATVQVSDGTNTVNTTAHPAVVKGAGTAGTPAAGVVTIQGVTSGTSVATSNSTQLPAALGQTIKSASLPVTLSSDQGSIQTAKVTSLLYDSGTVASGAVINSGCLDVSKIDALSVQALNSDATNDRLMIVYLYTDSACSGSSYDYVYATATKNLSYWTKACVGLGCGSNSSWSQNGAAAYWPTVLPPGIKVSLSAAGASNGRVLTFGR